MRSPPPLPFALSVRIAEYVGICGVLLCFFSFVSWMVIMSGCSSVTRSFNSSCLFVMLLIFSYRSVKSFLLWCDVVACECVVELSVVVWVVRAEGRSLRFWGPGLLSTSPAFSMSSASHSAGSSGRLAQKRELGPRVRTVYLCIQNRHSNQPTNMLWMCSHMCLSWPCYSFVDGLS